MGEQLMTLNPAILGEMESSVLVRNPPGSLHQDALRARLTAAHCEDVEGSGSHAAWVFTAVTERPVLLPLLELTTC